MSSDVKLSVTETGILDRCAQIEEMVGDIYRYFGKHFIEDDALSRLFFKTALEEDEHASQFKLASRLHGAGMKSVKTDLQGIESIQAMIQSVFDRVQQTPPAKKAALELAMKIEATLGEYHMNSIVVFEDPGLSTLFSSMRGNDHEHYLMLQKAFEAV